MARKRIAYALSAAALIAGSGVFTPAVWAEGDGPECTAANLAELQTCIDENATTIATTDTIVITGEGNSAVINTSGITFYGVEGKNMFSVEDGAILTFRGNGTINAGRYFATADGAELIIDGPTINATNSTCYGVYALNNGRVTMESGSITADYAALAGNNTTGDMNFYINGGLLTSNRYPAIYMPGQVDLVIRGGTLTGGIVARMGQIEIENSTINAQPNPVTDDGIDQNYSSMPSVANEAITLLAGTYKSANAEHGNDMNVTISGGNTQINGDIVLYDLGNTTAGYEQDVNVRIEEGHLTGFKTKYTEDEIGFTLRSGYTAGLNYNADRINVEIIGGEFETEPAEEDLIPGFETELNTEKNVYEVYPKQIDYRNWFVETFPEEEGDIFAFVEFGDVELIADRKASLSAEAVETDELTLTGEGELIGAIDINMIDRNRQVIEVADNDLMVVIELDEETYNMFAEYDKLYAVYFDEDGVEAERFEITLDKEEGDGITWYYLYFNTPHLSTYGVAGVNNETAAPDTGTVTAAGASAMSAALVTAIAVGLLTSIVSFAYLIRRR